MLMNHFPALNINIHIIWRNEIQLSLHPEQNRKRKALTWAPSYTTSFNNY